VNVKKIIAVPFQEGFETVHNAETLVFTDYRWNTGKVERGWHVNPLRVDLVKVTIRPYSIKTPEQ